ncbi:MAG TPA: S1/P1 nuclease [Caulobacteraceae bacterium]|nr:S1/P1 nuclease [Caulobacteraceae bacterium]
MLLFTGHSAWAWGPDAHQIVARVAYGRVSPQVQQAVDKIVAHGIDYAGCSAHTLDAFATFADCARTKGKYAPTANIHFDNIPLCDEPPRPPAPKPYCQDGVCVSEGIKRFVKVLNDPSASDDDRTEALAFVLHLTADAHEPFHAADNGDQDGVKVAIRLAPDAVPPNPPHHIRPEFHAIWDNALVWASVGNVDDGARAVKALAEAHAAQWRGGSPDSWVGESHALAQRAYKALSIACGAGPVGPVDVSKTYIDQFKGETADRLGQASVRLADVLSSALAADH